MKTISMDARAIEMMTDGWLTHSRIRDYDSHWSLKTYLAADDEGKMYVGVISGTSFFLSACSCKPLANLIILGTVEVVKQ